ncbi:hypothetical protein STHAL_32040 [Streptomyces halstedii]|uniref:Uncharacterized protein n=1 Tax=Streptomyces halstedii TaxID=1944 RepID=A0ABS6U1L1_STRHA|nr:hypothetical protein [Streptomyces halstedii]MBV7674079.1 hypothetical protein [Streptomyces halstedii]
MSEPTPVHRPDRGLTLQQHVSEGLRNCTNLLAYLTAGDRDDANFTVIAGAYLYGVCSAIVAAHEQLRLEHPGPNSPAAQAVNGPELLAVAERGRIGLSLHLASAPTVQERFGPVAEGYLESIRRSLADVLAWSVSAPQ